MLKQDCLKAIFNVTNNNKFYQRGTNSLMLHLV